MRVESFEVGDPAEFDRAFDASLKKNPKLVRLLVLRDERSIFVALRPR
jgi:hypothetical protein